MRTIIIAAIILFVSNAGAQEINQKYSYGDFSGQYFTEAEEFNDTIIIGSAFGIQDQPYSEVFPPDMRGVIFRRCNLDNAVVPEGNMVDESCTNKQIKLQNDNEYWVVDEELNPIEPHDKASFTKWNISHDPKDIPSFMSNIPLTIIKEREANEDIVIGD